MAQTNMQLTDWLDDLSVRFIVNLPLEELESMERICFQVEEAQWFYEDFVRPLDPNLPSLNLKQFSMNIFQHCPLFSGHSKELHAKAFAEFMAYKTRVPVRGAILLNATMDQVILVKGWKKGASWSFPRGKINKDEEDIDCAVRELYEETGFDAISAGIVTDKEDVKSIEVTMREQHMKLFVFAGVSMDTHFEPRTRKEISAIQWYRLSELPTLKRVKNQQDGGAQNGVNANKFYMVAPFVRPLKRIISQLKKERAHVMPAPAPAMLEPLNTISPSLAEQSGLMQLPSGSDMTRLMTQLRQSSQASREMNYPEVSNHDTAPSVPPFEADDLSTPLTRAPDPMQETQLAVARRESKANAMLSLLRSGSNTSAPFSMSNMAPQTPHEQMIGHPSQLPPSPRSRTVRAPHVADLPAPPVFEVSPEQVGRQSFSHGMPLGRALAASRHMHPSVQEQQNMLPSFLRDSSNSRAPPSHVANAPYHNIGDPTFAPNSRSLGGQNSNMAPHASKLPPPKLNAHSSNLLNLFKTGQPIPINTMAASASLLPAGETTRPELSPTSASFYRSQNTPLGNVTSPAMLSSTPALISPATSSQETSKRSSHQETLLNLFRQPKPSPSLAPPLDPVELSAQGSPTHSRVSSDFIRKEKTTVRHSANGDAKVTSRLELSSTPADSRVSATISGPLNVPQFDKILQRPQGHKAPIGLRHSREPPELRQVQPHQSVKILLRPNTANKPSQEVEVSQPASPSVKKSPQRKHHKSNASSRDLPFQPRILKRPETVRQQAIEQLQSEQQQQPPPRSQPLVGGDVAPIQTTPIPPDTMQRPLDTGTRILDRRSNQTQDQKAALLSLFGKAPTTAIAPSPAPPVAGGRRTSVVSPLSEKPPVGSTLPSPLGLGKSRLGSMQGDRVAPIRTKSSETAPSVTSPSDKKFLLGYLDGVASQGRS